MKHFKTISSKIRRDLKKVINPFYLIAFFVLILNSNTNAQTLISPTGDGGFETGATFPLNGWTAVNDLNSKWYVGTFAKSAGTRGAYIDVNGTAGAANNYNSGAIRISHFYKDVAIPSGATNISLSFKWKANGENAAGVDDYDFIRVFLVNTSTTPVASALLPIANSIGAGKYNLQSAAFQTATITISNALAGTTQRLVFTWKNDDSVTNNPGGAIDEVSLTYTPGSGCSGTPSPGNTVASANPVCSGVSFNLSLQNSTSGSGVTYQWQSSPNGSTWTNIATATSATYAATQTAATYYRSLVTCAGNTGTSNPLQVNMTPSINCVCTPSYTNSCSIDYISNVTFAGINNTTGCTGTTPSNLTTYNSPNPSLTGGLTYPISVTTDGDIEGLKVWIDYNMNGTFESGESVLSGLATATPNTFSGSVQVPLSVASGQTKMRVRCRYNNSTLDPCANYDYGETEDYLITLVAPPPCVTPPVAGTISGSTSICANVSTLYNLSGGSGTTQWQISSTAVGGPYTDISGANSSTYNYVASSSGTVYLRTKHSVLGCVDAFSNVLTITVNPGVSVTASASSPSVCPGTTVNLNSNASIAVSNTTDYPIPDFVLSNGIANSPINIAGFSPVNLTATTIKSVNFNINHSFTGDLRLRLFSPSGTVVTMVDQAGGAGVNFVNTTIVNSGGADGNIAAGSAPFTGTYNSQVALTGLTGAVNGQWILRAIDLASGDVGTILDWTLTLESDGVTYTWSSTPAGFSASSQATSDTPSQSTTYTVQATANGCSSTASVPVAISPLPEISISSSAPVCEGQSISLFSDNIASGQSSGNTYLWTGPNGFNDIVKNPTVNNSTQNSAGTYAVTVTNQFGCFAIDSTIVAINELPQLNVASQTNLVCNGASDGGFEIEVTNGPGVFLFDENGNTNFDGIFTGYPAGTYTVQVTDGNSCLSTIGVSLTEPDPTTIPDAGTNQSVCFGATATLAANSAEIGTGTWSVVTGSGTFADPNSPTTTVSGLSAGVNTFSWTIENSLCNVSNSDNVNVTTIPLPTATLTGTQEICNGSNASLSISFTGTGPWTYAVNGGPSVVASSNPELVTVNPSVSTTYSVTSLSDGNCAGSGSGSAVVTVTNAPPANSVFLTPASMPTTASGCVGGTYVVSSNSVIGATSYTWSVPAGTLINGVSGPLTTTGNTVTLTLGTLIANSSGWEICVSAANACGQTNTNCKYIRGALSTPAPIAGSTVACPSTSGTYSTNAVTGATSYVWTGTNGITFTGSGLSVTANFPSGFSSGSICVSGQLPCGYTGPSRCINVTNGTPLLGNMSGTFTVCPGAIGVSFSVPPSPGANTFNWVLPTGATLVNGTGTNAITVDFGPTFNGGNICVTAQSICGITSLPRCRTIGSNKPATPGNIIGAVNGVCGQTITYSIPAVSGATSYTWTAPAGATLTSLNGTNSIDVTYSNSFTTGNLCVTANNGCGSSTPRCVLAKATPATPGSIGGPAVICAFESGDVYSVATVFGASGYVWTVPSGATIQSGQGTNSILVDWGANGGTITVTASGPCGNSGTKTLNVVMTCKISSGTLPEAALNAYPNPVSNNLTVELDAQIAGTYSVELMDLSGRVVYATRMDAVIGSNSNVIDVANYSKGVYTLNVRSNEGFSKQIRVAIQ